MSKLEKQRVQELWQAIGWGHNDKVDRLLRLEGVSPNALNDQGRTMLSVAMVNDNHEAMRLLLAAGADPNGRNNNGHKAFRDVQSLAALNTLIDAGFDLNEPCSDELVPLDYAVRTKMYGVVKLLLDRGVQVPPHMREATYWDNLGKGGVRSQRMIFADLTAATISNAMAEPAEDSEPSKSINAGVSPL